jgi:hypothetical protein
MPLLDEPDTNFTRSYKISRESKNALKCYKELYNQKLKTATQVSIFTLPFSYHFT